MRKLQNMRFNYKICAACVATVMTAIFATGDSLALLQAKTQTLENNFAYGLVNIVPEETFTPKDIRKGEVVKRCGSKIAAQMKKRRAA